MSSEAMILLGVIGAPHGIKGHIKIYTYTEQPENITAYGALSDKSGKKQFDISIIRSMPDHVIASVKGYPDRNAIEKLRGQELYVPRSRLPEPKDDEYYIEDLIGLEIRDTQHSIIGHIASIQNFGSGDIVEIKMMDGKSEFHALLHFSEINIQKRYAILDLPDIIEAEDEA